MSNLATPDIDNDEATQEILRLRGFPVKNREGAPLTPKGTAPEKTASLDLSDAKLVPSLIIVRTTFFYQNNRLEKRTDEIIARFYTTKIKPKLIDKVSSQMEAAKQSGFEGSYEILSRRGRPLASVRRSVDRAKESMIIINPKANPSGAIRQIATHPSGASHVMIQTPEQLRKIVPVAKRIGIEKIYVPEKVLAAASQLDRKLIIASGLIVPIPDIEVRKSSLRIHQPKNNLHSDTKSVAKPNTQIIQDELRKEPIKSNIWEGTKLPVREASVEDLATSRDTAKDQSILERILNSITNDIATAEEDGLNPRGSLLNLKRAHDHIQAITTQTKDERKAPNSITSNESTTISIYEDRLPLSNAASRSITPKRPIFESEPVILKPDFAATPSKELKETRAKSAVEILRASQKPKRITKSTNLTIAA